MKQFQPGDRAIIIGGKNLNNLGKEVNLVKTIYLQPDEKIFIGGLNWVNDSQNADEFWHVNENDFRVKALSGISHTISDILVLEKNLMPLFDDSVVNETVEELVLEK